MLTITIETDNAAFEDWPREGCHEVARILSKLAEDIGGGVLPSTLRDINGNRVGTVVDDSEDAKA